MDATNERYFAADLKRELGRYVPVECVVGSERVERPVAFAEVFATLYHNLGLDVNKVTVNDLSGRPQFLVDGGAQPIAELVG